MSQIQASHILVKHQYEAEDLLKKLAQGEEFSDLAKNSQPALPRARAATLASSAVVRWFQLLKRLRLA